MIESLLLIGGLWFWMLALLFVVLVTAFLDQEVYGFIVVFTILGALIFYFLGRGREIVDYYINNPTSILVHIGLYVVLGALYSVLKWFLFVKNKKNEYLKEKKEFVEGKLKEGRCESTIKASWKESFGSFESFAKYLTPSKNKGKITFWIIYWPFSLLSLILRDLTVEIATFVMNKLGSVYKAVSKGQFSDIEEDLK